MVVCLVRMTDVKNICKRLMSVVCAVRVKCTIAEGEYEYLLAGTAADCCKLCCHQPPRPTQPPTLYVLKISTSQSVVKLCSRGVKAGMSHSIRGLNVWVADKTRSLVNT